MDITDDDVYAAMQRIPGYVDVSVGDCMAIYRFTQEHAKRRSLEQIRADRLMRKSREATQLEAERHYSFEEELQRTFDGVYAGSGIST